MFVSQVSLPTLPIFENYGTQFITFIPDKSSHVGLWAAYIKEDF
jgi:hypothetical protein